MKSAEEQPSRRRLPKYFTRSMKDGPSKTCENKASLISAPGAPRFSIDHLDGICGVSGSRRRNAFTTFSSVDVIENTPGVVELFRGFNSAESTLRPVVLLFVRVFCYPLIDVRAFPLDYAFYLVIVREVVGQRC